MDNTPLEQVSVETDLGVTVDDQLRFHHHTTRCVNKANQMLGIIKTSFENLDEVTIPLLHKVLVRPHLEYCNSVWGPH